MTDDELKPCPFCGSKAEIYKYSGKDYHTVWVGCSKCQVGTPRVRVEKAIEIWNRRVKG